MESTALINILRQDVERNIAFARNNFSELSEKQFNWRISPIKWTIGQCIQHINMSGRYYLKQFENVLRKGVKASGSSDFKPGFLASYMLKLIKPKPGIKLTTPEIFEPHFLVNGQATMNEFFELQNHFEKLADRIREYDLNKNKFRSRATPLVRLKLGDAFQLNNQHTARHLNQAFALKSAPGFPVE